MNLFSEKLSTTIAVVAFGLNLGFSEPAAATLLDVEPLNGDVATTTVELVHSGGASADAGIFSLVPDDSDVVRISGLQPGDVIAAMTTPLGGSFTSPDTVIGVLDSSGTILDFNDDAGAGFGSAIRIESTDGADLFVGATGVVDSTGTHQEIGSYVFSASVLSSGASPLSSLSRGGSVSAAAGVNTLGASGTPDSILLLGVSSGDVVSVLTTPLGSPGFSLPNTNVAVLDPLGALIMFNEDAGGFGAGLRFVASQPGDYELLVGGPSAGDYGLLVSIRAVPEPSREAVIALGGMALFLFCNARERMEA